MVQTGPEDVYRRVKTRMWLSGSFMRLSRAEPNAQTLFFYLLTCPESRSLPGLVFGGRAGLAEALGWLPEPFTERFGELLAEGMAVADWERRLVFLPAGPEHNKPANPNVVKGWGAQYRVLPDESPVKASVYASCSAVVSCLTEGFQEAFKESFPKPLGKPFAKPFLQPFGKQGVGSREEEDNTPIPPQGGLDVPPDDDEEEAEPDLLSSSKQPAKSRRKTRSYELEASATGFDDWWEVWPYHVGRADAEKAWVTTLETADREGILGLTADYLAKREAGADAGCFVPTLPLPGTYLRQKRWRDEFTSKQGGNGGNGRDSHHDDEGEQALDWSVDEVEEVTV